MSETLFGAWSIEIQGGKRIFPLGRGQRFRIMGSDSSDGIYYSTTGPQQLVSFGNEWNIVMELSHLTFTPDYEIWDQSNVKKHANYTVKEGLVMVFIRDEGLELDDYINQGGLVITCTSLDPALNPLHTPGCPFDFTIPEEAIIEDDKKKVKSKTRKKR